MKYPAEARAKGVQGKVVVSIVINEFGQLESKEIKRGIGAGCDQEALKSIDRGFLTAWNPAILGGKAVKVKFDYPILFRLR